MRRAGWLAALVVSMAGASIPLLAPAAQAGGGTFDFGRRYYIPGQTAIGRSQFSTEIGGTGRPSDGPFFAYLLRRRNGPIGFDPRDGILLAQVKIMRGSPYAGEPLPTAVVRFQVPDVQPGRHWIGLCNDPCTDTFLGDLMGGWIGVAATQEQARLWKLRDELREQTDGKLAETTDQLQRAIDAADRSEVARFQTTEETLSALSTRIEELQARADHLSDRLTDQARLVRAAESTGWVSAFAPFGWLVAAALAVALGMGWWHLRRVRQAPGLLAEPDDPWMPPGRRSLPRPAFELGDLSLTLDPPTPPPPTPPTRLGAAWRAPSA